MITALIESLDPQVLVLPGGSRAALLPEAWSAASWEGLAADPAGRAMLDRLLDRAAAMSTEPETVLPFSAWMRFFRDGDRQEYEDHYFRRRRRLETFALAVLSGRGDHYLPLLENLLWAICDEYSWCLPAHVDPPRVKGRSPPQRDPFSCVDLFAAETASALAETVSLLDHRLAPELQWRARDQVMRRVLDQFLDGSPAHGWESATHNWAAVCGGGVGLAALWLLDDPAELKRVLGRVGAALDCYLAGFPDDGVCLEGLGYWTYGMGYFTAFAELLRDRSGAHADLWRLPGLQPRLQAIAAFPGHCLLGRQSLARFSDAPAEFRFSAGILCRLAERLPGADLPPAHLAETLDDDPCARFARHLRDFAWYVPAHFALPRTRHDLACCTWLSSAQWLLVKGYLGDAPIGLAAKSGHNDEAHNHNDVGSFMLVAGSDVLLEDLGAGRYERDYFREGRYGYFVNASRSHNLPLVDEAGQQAGPDFAAGQVQCRQEKDWIELSMDLAGAYGLPHLSSLRRTLGTTRFSPDHIQLADTFSFGDTHDHGIRERFVTQVPVEQKGPAEVIIRGHEFELEIKASTPPTRIEISTVSYAPHQGPNREARCIDFIFDCQDAVMDCRFTLDIRRQSRPPHWPAAHRHDGREA